MDNEIEKKDIKTLIEQQNLELEPIKEKLPRIDKTGYRNVYQDKNTNDFIFEGGKNGSITKINLYGDGKVKRNGTEIFLKEYFYKFDELKGIPDTSKTLFIAILGCLAEQKKQRVTLSIDDYMQLRGLKDKKETLKQINRDLEFLQSITLSFQNRQTKEYAVICSFSKITKDNVYFEFSTLYFEHLIKYAPLLYIPDEAFKDMKKYPNKLFFSYRLSLHKLLNHGKPNENIIPVKSLLDSTPNIPKYEEIKGKGELRKRIIGPFERDLNSLNNVLKWHYCDNRGDLVDPPRKYKDFEQSFIKFMFLDYPELPTRKKKKKKQTGKKRLTDGKETNQ